MKKIGYILVIFLLLCGCSAEPEVTTQPAATEAAHAVETAVREKILIQEEAAALVEQPPAPACVVLQPDPAGILEERCEDAVIDYSHTADGYVMARYLAQTDKRLKAIVKGPSATYTYNLTPGEWTVFPLSDGNGEYQMGIYINAMENKYAAVMVTSFVVELSDEFAPFLRPNQYVDYISAPETVALGAELTCGITDPLKKVEIVYDYVVGNFTYDYEKASTVKSGYLPVLDAVLAEKKGICFDYAAVMTAMLRSQEVPCKLVVGYAGEVYHAWISVWTEEHGWVDGAIFFDGQVWKRMDPTFASSGDKSEEIMDFIEHGDYRVKYLY